MISQLPSFPNLFFFCRKFFRSNFGAFGLFRTCDTSAAAVVAVVAAVVAVVAAADVDTGQKAMMPPELQLPSRVPIIIMSLVV